MTDALNIEVKAPQEAILDLPQERITGDILRGRGPRRGNLETLIKYWRPIMRKPGGFRRCLVILADHPELYPLERICAWLHHETTGQWPNEGNHHAGGKLGQIRKIRRVVKKSKRTSKKDILEFGFDAPMHAWERRTARENKSQIYAPLDGSFEQMDWKAGRRAERIAESVLLPGERGALKPRHAARTVLTPGGSGLPGPGAKPFKRILPGGGGSGTRGFRCPAGFEHGGRFTNSQYSTCGAQLFGVPGTRNRGNIGQAIGQKSAGSPTILSDLAFPEPQQRPNPTKQETVTGKIVESMASVASAKKMRRMVRSDGSILVPTATMEVLAKQVDDNEDLTNATFITSIPGPQAFGAEELELFKTGLKSLVFALPGGGTVTLSRKNPGPMTPGEARSFGKALRTARSATIPELHYAGILKAVADATDSADFTISIPGEADATKIVRVKGPNGTVDAPMWVYKTFLAADAPGRKEGPTYTLEGSRDVSDVAKKWARRK